MPGDKLRSWFNSGETPLVLCKPAVDAQEGFWSPLALTGALFAAGFPGRFPVWQGAFSEASQLTNGRLAYTSPTNAIGSYMRHEIYYERDPTGLTVPELKVDVFYRLSNKHTHNDEMHFVSSAVTSNNRIGPKRSFLLEGNAAGVNLPACWLDSTVQWSIRMIDPLDVGTWTESQTNYEWCE